MNILFTGMDWFPERQDGGLSRYFYEEVQAFAAAGFEGTACVSCCQPQKVAAINVRGMAGRNAPVFRRWKGASDLVQEGIRNGANLIDSHFALYARPALHRIPRHMPLVVHFHGPWTQEILMESTGFTGRFRAALARRIERDVYARADRVIAMVRAAELADGLQVCLVAHGHFLRILAARWLGFAPDAGRHLALSPASISELGYERETPVIRRWNET